MQPCIHGEHFLQQSKQMSTQTASTAPEDGNADRSALKELNAEVLEQFEKFLKEFASVTQAITVSDNVKHFFA